MIARLTVVDGTLTEYPLAQRMLGGWQNGVTFYPDENVTEVQQVLVVPVPHVPFGPEGVPAMLADATYLDHAASNLEGKFQIGGSNVRATVVRMLRNVATALRAAHGSAGREFAQCSTCHGGPVCYCTDTGFPTSPQPAVQDHENGGIDA